MASDKARTAKAPAAQAPGLPLHRRGRRLAVIALMLAVAALAWFWRPLAAQATTATAYGARIACACRFIAGRELSDCTRDFEDGMGLVMLGEDAQQRSVTATIPLLSRQTATFREGAGCRLDAWDD